MIHIADTKVERRYGDFFIRQIHKFEEVRLTGPLFPTSMLINSCYELPAPPPLPPYPPLWLQANMHVLWPK